MSVIESNITIDIPDGVDAANIVSAIRHVISELNKKDTHVNVVEVDNPLSLSPVVMKKIKD